MVQETAGGRVDSVDVVHRLLRASIFEEQVVRFFDRSISNHRQPFQTYI